MTQLSFLSAAVVCSTMDWNPGHIQRADKPFGIVTLQRQPHMRNRNTASTMAHSFCHTMWSVQ